MIQVEAGFKALLPAPPGRSTTRVHDTANGVVWLNDEGVQVAVRSRHHRCQVKDSRKVSHHLMGEVFR
jgi:hypothetical protein